MELGNIMTMEVKDAVVLCFVSFLIGSLVFLLVTSSTNKTNWERKLEKSGHAEYYLDEDNNKKWRLLPVPKE